MASKLSHGICTPQKIFCTILKLVNINWPILQEGKPGPQPASMANKFCPGMKPSGTSWWCPGCELNASNMFFTRIKPWIGCSYLSLLYYALLTFKIAFIISTWARCINYYLTLNATNRWKHSHLKQLSWLKLLVAGILLYIICMTI